MRRDSIRFCKNIATLQALGVKNLEFLNCQDSTMQTLPEFEPRRSRTVATMLFAKSTASSNWLNDSPLYSQYENVLIVALTTDETNRISFEMALAQALASDRVTIRASNEIMDIKQLPRETSMTPITSQREDRDAP